MWPEILAVLLLARIFFIDSLTPSSHVVFPLFPFYYFYVHRGKNKVFRDRKTVHRSNQITGSYFGLLYTQRGYANTDLRPGDLRGRFSTGSAGQRDGCSLNGAEHLRTILNGRNHWKQYNTKHRTVIPMFLCVHTVLSLSVYKICLFLDCVSQKHLEKTCT